MSKEQDAINSRLSAMIATTPPFGASHEDRYPAIWSAISELGPINGFDSLCEAVNEAIDLAVAEARNSALEEAAKVADARAAICRDAQKLGPETLPNVEIHTALEAEHIAAAIRGMIK